MADDALVVSSGNDHGGLIVDWQRLWLSIRTARQGRWRSLALVPAGPIPAELMLNISVTLARTAMVHVGAPVHVADATKLTLAQLEPFTELLRQRIDNGDLVIVALAALNESVTALPIAKVAEAALLCVVSGKMTTDSAKRTVSQVGAQHFIGSTMFRLED